MLSGASLCSFTCAAICNVCVAARWSFMLSLISVFLLLPVKKVALVLSNAVMISHVLPPKWQLLVFSSYWETYQILERGRNLLLYLLKLLFFGFLKILLFHQT